MKLNQKQETQVSITDWADRTFGIRSPGEVAARMNVEVAELINGFGTYGLAPQSPEAREHLLEECADVYIMLVQVVQKLGGSDLGALATMKMQTNRARRWERLRSGQMQHVAEEPAPELWVHPVNGLLMDLSKWYILSDSESFYIPQGFDSSEEALKWAQSPETVKATGTLNARAPMFMGPSIGWLEVGDTNIFKAADLKAWYDLKASPDNAQREEQQ